MLSLLVLLFPELLYSELPSSEHLSAIPFHQGVALKL